MKSIKRSAAALAIAALAIAGWTGSAQAGLIELKATMDGAQADGGLGTGSPGTGTALVIFDDVTNEFSWDISWSGLQAPVTVAHFHGPAGPGVNAGIQVDFLTISPGNPSVGSTTITDGQAADLLAGLWYVNIHSQLFPGGEIRGQVNRVPLPSTLALFALGLLAMRRAINA